MEGYLNLFYFRVQEELQHVLLLMLHSLTRLSCFESLKESRHGKIFNLLLTSLSILNSRIVYFSLRFSFVKYSEIKKAGVAGASIVLQFA